MNTINIPKENIIIQGITHDPWSSHPYIVYFNDQNGQEHIDVCTWYIESEDGYFECNIHYTRRLCNTLEDMRNLTYLDIENQAYGSWMDGAR